MPHFWYSKKHTEYSARLNRSRLQGERKMPINICEVNGQRHAFTLKQDELPLDEIYVWGDAIYLGKGEHVGAQGCW